jgi:hypothetical protein
MYEVFDSASAPELNSEILTLTAGTLCIRIALFAGPAFGIFTTEWH